MAPEHEVGSSLMLRSSSPLVRDRYTYRPRAHRLCRAPGCVLPGPTARRTGTSRGRRSIRSAGGAPKKPAAATAARLRAASKPTCDSTLRRQEGRAAGRWVRRPAPPTSLEVHSNSSICVATGPGAAQVQAQAVQDRSAPNVSAGHGGGPGSTVAPPPRCGQCGFTGAGSGRPESLALSICHRPQRHVVAGAGSSSASPRTCWVCSVPCHAPPAKLHRWPRAAGLQLHRGHRRHRRQQMRAQQFQQRIREFGRVVVQAVLHTRSQESHALAADVRHAGRRPHRRSCRSRRRHLGVGLGEFTGQLADGRQFAVVVRQQGVTHGRLAFTGFRFRAR